MRTEFVIVASVDVHTTPMHYGSRVTARNDATRFDRWAAKVSATPGGCWLWLGQHTSAGYGVFMWSSGRRTTAHRASYRLLVGDIGDHEEADHLCRNRGCVNPTHIEAVSVGENRRRRIVATGVLTTNGRRTQCRNGHAFVGDNLIQRADRRVCRACAAAANRRHRTRSSVP
jgi:hypothetical protein